MRSPFLLGGRRKVAAATQRVCHTMLKGIDKQVTTHLAGSGWSSTKSERTLWKYPTFEESEICESLREDVCGIGHNVGSPK